MQRPLPDGEGGLDADAGEAGALGLDPAPMIAPEIVERGPLLTLPADVLPLLAANDA